MFPQKRCCKFTTKNLSQKFFCKFCLQHFFRSELIAVCVRPQVLMIARHHRHRIASAIFEVTLSAQVTITHQRNPFVPPGAIREPPAPGISPGAAAAVAAAAAAKFRSRSALCPVLQVGCSGDLEGTNFDLIMNGNPPTSPARPQP